MPTYRIPVRALVDVEATDIRLALATLNLPGAFELGLAEMVDWHPDGEPVEVEP